MKMAFFKEIIYPKSIFRKFSQRFRQVTLSSSRKGYIQRSQNQHNQVHNVQQLKTMNIMSMCIHQRNFCAIQSSFHLRVLSQAITLKGAHRIYCSTCILFRVIFSGCLRFLYVRRTASQQQLTSSLRRLGRCRVTSVGRLPRIPSSLFSR